MARRLLLPLLAIAGFATLAAALPAPRPRPFRLGGLDLRGAFKADVNLLREQSEAARRNALEEAAEIERLRRERGRR